MKGCLFCKIAKKEIPAAIFYEDDKTMSFLDIKPHSLGHSVVILKNHSENILDTNEVDLSNLFFTVKKTAAILQKALNPDGFTIGINHGEIAGQLIKHLHIHIIPRYKGDGGGSIHSAVNNPPKEPLDNIMAKILQIS